ncbi:MAG: alpha/beta hydrolase family protein [Paracoccaceae bacterium]
MARWGGAKRLFACLMLAQLLAPWSSAALAEPPEVVFLPGLGDGKDSFRAVARALKGAAPMVLDERPDWIKGDADGRRSGLDVARDLHARLATAGHTPPYVLVGHSLGGTYALAYATAYPDEVAGILLVDARLPGFEASCKAAGQKTCTIPDLIYALLPAVQKREVDGMADTPAQVAPPQGYGDIPITVIVATRPSVGLSASWQAVWIEEATRFAAGLKNGRLVKAEGSRHYVQRQAKALVVQELRDLLARAN